MKVHCASGNDDLGNRTLTVNKDWTWSFCDNFFVTNTLFFCHLWWGLKNRSFDVYASKWPVDCPGRFCLWVAKSDGIYFRGRYGLEKQYDWQ